MNIEEPSGRYTAEQLQVIGLPVDARALVKAAAGTGKTHALAGRLTWLTEAQGLSAGDEVLVLSFSRAAVTELRRRIVGLHGDARYVGAATFDSFATRILAAAEPDPARLARMDYDTRIRAAADYLSRQGVPDDLRLVRHILVDEIQDLVGPRADLVMALLEKLGTGFTLFGDPAQAIYNYQQDRSPGELELYSRVHQLFGGDVIALGLTRDYRSTTPQADRIARAGARLRSPAADAASIAHDLRSILLNLPTLQVVAARRMVNRGDKSTAFLTRTNGEALLLSRTLFESGIPHRYQRRGEEKAAPGWIGKLVAGLTETRVTRATLDRRLTEVAASESVEPDSLYAYVRALSPRRGQTIDLQRVADHVREQNLPEDLNAVAAAAAVVSTVHRAKGLEFDRVLLTAPWDSRDTDPAGENRVMYVALSRARQEIFHVDRPDTVGVSVDQRTQRWVRRGFGPLRWQVREIEVTGQDVDATQPAGAWQLEEPVRDVQEYLGAQVRPGDPVELRLVGGSRHDSPVAHYDICHDGHVVGLTSEEFGRSLGLALDARRQGGWPERIEGLHVELVDTVAGDASAGRSHGLGCSGMWLRARVFGLGVLRFGGSAEAGSA